MLENKIISDDDKGHQPSERWAEFTDDNVLAALPRGTQVLGNFPHGASFWSRTARIDTQQEDGLRKSFFVKLTSGLAGKAMVAGELESMTALHQNIPFATPAPIGCGTYASNPSIHFFLCDFTEMMDELPDIQRFTSTVAQLHRVSNSPNGKYGFPVPTYMGRMAQHTAWTESWEVFFTDYMQHLMCTIESAQGPDPEFKELFEAVVQKVIPRLMRPLETGGRSIKPSLVHGNLYAGNVSVDEEALEPIVYDATCLYAHNEWDLAPWGLLRHKIGKPYMKAYFRHFPISEPEEDQEDRNKLYIWRWEMKGLAIYPGDLRYKTYAIEAMRALIQRFPDGYEGWAKEKGEEPAPHPQTNSS